MFFSDTLHGRIYVGFLLTRWAMNFRRTFSGRKAIRDSHNNGIEYVRFAYRTVSPLRGSAAAAHVERCAT